VNSRLTVLVPERHGLEALADLPNVHSVLYGEGVAPRGDADDAQVMVVTYSAVDDAAELMRALPRLRLVQTLTAGTDMWTDRIPSGVLLSNASGAAHRCRLPGSAARRLRRRERQPW
jgi:phosphoglycerate dehydrogenase-like enzyme